MLMPPRSDLSVALWSIILRSAELVLCLAAYIVFSNHPGHGAKGLLQLPLLFSRIRDLVYTAERGPVPPRSYST
jgi:hypothetical protein